jgi:hypothetical protein
LFSSTSSSLSTPYGVIYQNDINANTNLAVESLYYLDSHAILSSNDQPFEYNNNNNNYQSNSFSNDIYNTNTNTISINLDAQINIDLNDVLLKSELSLERLNSTVSRMSLDEDVSLDIENEIDLLLHEQSIFDTVLCVCVWGGGGRNVR